MGSANIHGYILYCTRNRPKKEELFRRISIFGRMLCKGNNFVKIKICILYKFKSVHKRPFKISLCKVPMLRAQKNAKK